MEARLTIEGQMLGLSSSEFRKELSLADKQYQKDILKKVHLLHLRDTQICNQIIEENLQATLHENDRIKQEIEEIKTERNRNQADAMNNLQKIDNYVSLWHKKRFMSKYYQALKDNWLTRKEAKTFIHTKVEKFDYNFTTVEQLKKRVNQQVDTEMKHKQHKLAHLELLIREFEDQYKIQLQKRALVRNVCDDGYKQGSMKMSADALRMSMSTLRDLETKFMKTYKAQIESQQKSTVEKMNSKMVYQRVTQ